MLTPGTDSQSFLLKPAHSQKCQQKKSYIGTKREAKKNLTWIYYFLLVQRHIQPNTAMLTKMTKAA
ncbi:hypothetical protein C8R11_101299 [Nitrosomonas aestuarii]|nr:hypothetical protein C8R11_101299 [Nitrosomonas aestuarii]